MTTPNPKIKKVLDTLERETKKSAEKLLENFTRLPAEMLSQVTGKEMTIPKNYTDIDTSHIEAQHQTKTQDELSTVRDRLAKLQQPDSHRFNEFRREERQAINEIREEKQERLQRLAQEERQKNEAKEAEEQRSRQSAPLPTGIVRGNIFSKKKPQKTAENRPAFGKM